MIKFTLTCPDDHRFDSWFASSEAFETLQKGKMISCTQCGATEVTKALMAPAVSVSESAPLSAPTETEAKIAAMRNHVEATADDVGKNFAKEARDMHDGVIPDRPIYGEANLKEARSLLEDGVPVVPLPFMNKRKAN